MTSFYSPESRAERLIAGGRVVLAASSLLAVWLDPTEPAKFASVAYALLAAYLVYAVGLALLVLRAAAAPGRLRLLSHAFDLAFFSLFTYFTAGPASPFIPYFVFSLVCATLRWQWRGTLWTAAVALGTFLGLGVYYAEVLRDPSFQVMPFIIRAVYLAVYAVLLGYLGFHEERTRGEMAKLAAWPVARAEEPPRATRQLLSTAAAVLGAPRVVAVWVDSEEPWRYWASWSAEQFSWRKDGPALAPLVAEPLAAASFLCPDPTRESPTVILREAGRISRWRGRPLAGGAGERLGESSVLSVPLVGEMLQGRLFVLGKPGPTSDDLVLGEIVAGIVVARLDHAYLIQQLRLAAAAQERARLARDLHDGVLQTFTGVGLRIAALRRKAESAGESLAAPLAELQQVVADEQRDVRLLIQDLESRVQDEDSGGRPLGERLADLVARIEQTWGVSVALRVEERCAAAAGSAAREVYSMVREAVVNAARHGGASHVAVELRADGERGLSIAVSDDGRGFPFSGRFELAELEARDLGPRTLRSRLTELGGGMSLVSESTGARIEMIVPRGSGAG